VVLAYLAVACVLFACGRLSVATPAESVEDAGEEHEEHGHEGEMVTAK
jgi:hypothetical protein